MSDERHKKPPPEGDAEPVTDTFRKEAKLALELNAQSNALRGLKRDDAGYRISSQSELATALSELYDREVSRRMVQKILGPVREGTKVELVDRSVYVGPIRQLLELAPITTVSVRTTRAQVVQWIAELPDEQFRNFEDAVRKQIQRRR